MSKRLLISSVLLFFLQNASTLGQFIKVIDHNSFSARAIRLNFGAALPGASAGDLHFKWGVTFRGQGATAPIVVERELPCISVNCGLFNLGQRSVANVTPPGLADQPLTVNFESPVVRVGFQLFQATKGATFKALDPQGSLLGMIDFSQARNNVFLGLETTAPQGMAKVVIDYNVSPPQQTAEQIDELVFEYAEDRPFTTFLAQIGHGPLATATATFLQTAATGIQTSIILSNPTHLEAKGTLTLFDSAGQPFHLTLEGLPPVPPGPMILPPPGVSFSVPPFSSTTLTTTGQVKAPFSGYARILSNAPLEVLGIFRAKGTTATAAEAGVAGGSGKLTMTGRVEKLELDQFDSGVAIVNTSDRETTVALSAFEPPPGRNASKELKLGPRQHLADFLGELFPSLAAGDFKGRLFISSTEPVAVIILRTKNGLAVSSLPVASTQRD